MKPSLHDAAYAALMIDDPAEKCAAVDRMNAAWLHGELQVVAGPHRSEAVWSPGRPARPELVPPQQVQMRRVTNPTGHAALLHAITHIEFNAINLALDCVYRFCAFPEAFHTGWLQVAVEEASHFGLMRARLQALGFDYGDFTAHDGLWEMACRTAGDPLARMALVPRVLEARGLDATPLIMKKLQGIGDRDSVAVLEIILRDEVGHVALGDHWFRQLCHERQLEPEATYLALMEQFAAPWPSPPLHEEARRRAGFTAAELRILSQPRHAAHKQHEAAEP